MSFNLLTTKQAVALISQRTGKPISPRQLRHEIQTGHLHAEKVANTYFLEPDDVEHYTRRKPGKPKQT